MIDQHAKKIADAWNTFATKKQALDSTFELRIQPKIVARIIDLGQPALTAHGEDPAEAGTAELLQAMRNYCRALRLPKTNAWDKWNLYQFCNHGYCNFLEGIFNIDNYDKTHFEGGKTDEPKTIFDFY